MPFARAIFCSHTQYDDNSFLAAIASLVRPSVGRCSMPRIRRSIVESSVGDWIGGFSSAIVVLLYYEMMRNAAKNDIARICALNILVD